MKIKLLLILTMSITLANSSFSQNLTDLLPEIPKDWKIPGDDRIYDSGSLYEYINGGAELYISYGMKEVASRLISNSDGDEIRIEIFDMISAKNAFGVFSHTRTRDDGKFGQGSQYFPGTQIFWKDQYYISIMATDENENIRYALNELSSRIDEKISGTGDMPAIIKLLPKENLEKDAFMYFHHYIWLNSYYFIADDNFLYIDQNTNALLAKYGNKENRYYLLLVEYVDPEKANSVLSVFKEKFLDPDSEETVVLIEDGKWLGGSVKDKYLICVFNANSKFEAEKLISNTKDNIQP
jgi:hypothetical protein